MRSMRIVFFLVVVALFIGSLTGSNSALADEPVIVEEIDSSEWIEYDGLNPIYPNAYYLERSCVYWQIVLPELTEEGHYYELQGWYPNARFSSLQSYNSMYTVDHRYDFETDPDSGSVNPFRNGTPYPTQDIDGEIASDYGVLKYTIRLEPVTDTDEIPQVRPENTLYVITNDNGNWSVMYRVYANDLEENAYINPYAYYYAPGNPERWWQKRGQVVLPRIFHMSTNGTSSMISGAAEPTEEELFRAEFPDVPLIGAGSMTSYTDWVIGNSFSHFANTAAVYLMTYFAQDVDEVGVVRFKPPFSPNTNEGDVIDSSTQETRYWSFCSHIPNTMTTIDCISDHDFVVDDDGYITIVFSPPTNKPVNASNWLPYGCETDEYGNPLTCGALVYYRHLLPSGITFPESPYFFAEDCAASFFPPSEDYDSCLEDVCAIADAAGEYFPTSSLCSQSAYEACQASCMVGFVGLPTYADNFGKTAAPIELTDSDCDDDVDGFDLYQVAAYTETACE